MDTATKIRLAFIVLLWLALCWILISASERITLYTVFVIAASGVVVFVPLYKKYNKK